MSTNINLNGIHELDLNLTGTTTAAITTPGVVTIENTIVLPENTPAVAHEWLNSYSSTTGAFTETQPAVGDVIGAAPLASPTFTGTPAAPTATAGTNTTQLATTAFVTPAVSAAVTLADSKAEVTLGTTAPASPNVGDVWVNTSGSVEVVNTWSGSAWVVSADVTGQNTALNTANVGNQTAATVAGGATGVLLQNPNFAAGNVGWALDPGASIVASGGTVPASPSGSPNVLQIAYTGSAYAVNSQVIPCAAGGVLSLSAYCYGVSGATGSVSISLNYKNAAGSGLGDVVSAYATPTAAWQFLRVVTPPLPAGTAYVVIVANVQGTTNSDAWFFSGFSASILPNSVDEVPGAAPLASPTFTGTVTQPTPDVLTAATTGTTATAGAATALPATPLGYLEMTINGTVVKIPYYSV